MLLDRSPDQTMLQETTANFLDDLSGPDAVRDLRDDSVGFDVSFWRRGAELGWTSLLVREAHGGGSIGDHGLVDLALLAYEFGRHAAPGPLTPTNVVAALLSQRGKEAHRAVVDGLVGGTTVAAWCAPDPVGGDLLGGGSIDIRLDGDDVVLNGAQRPVDAATNAEVLVVTARNADGFTNVVVPTATPGVTVRPLRSTDLTRRFGAVDLVDVRIPRSSVVGTFGAADGDVQWMLEVALVITAAESVGAMQAAFDMTVEWAFDRYSFGRPLASYQALKHRFADMKSWLEAGHAIADAAAVAVALQAADAAAQVSAAAAFIGSHGIELGQDCIQIHGGIGLTFEHDLHLFLRRIQVNQSVYGSPAQHRARLADLVQLDVEAEMAS